MQLLGRDERMFTSTPSKPALKWDALGLLSAQAHSAPRVHLHHPKSELGFQECNITTSTLKAAASVCTAVEILRDSYYYTRSRKLQIKLLHVQFLFKRGHDIGAVCTSGDVQYKLVLFQFRVLTPSISFPGNWHGGLWGGSYMVAQTGPVS